MGVVFQFSVASTHVIFNDIYLTCFISFGILFLGYMGYITYSRDQERRVLEKINKKFQAMAEEMTAIKVLSRRKNE